MSAPALTPARFDAFARALAESVPELATSVDPEDLATYGRDWTRVYEPRPSLVAFPRSRDEVSRLLALANLHGVPVVPSGGRTGLAAGAVAKDGELVLSLTRMRRMDPVDLSGPPCASRPARSPRRSTSTARRTGSPGPSTSRRRARAHVGRQHRHERGRREGDPLRPHAAVGAGARGRHSRRRGARAQRRAREEQHGHRPAPALHRQRGHARGRSRRRRSSSRSCPRGSRRALRHA
jgi:hypothetical protein